MRPVPPGQVVAGEQRDHGQPLHGHGQVLPDHLAQLVGLALEAEDHALDLLVVLELGLEQPDHLHGRAGGTGDGHRRVAVGREDLLHGPVGDGVALGGPAVTGHHDAVGEPQGHHRGPVAELGGPRPPVRPTAPRRRGHGRVQRHLQPSDQPGEVGPGIFGCREERQRHRGYSPPFCT